VSSPDCRQIAQVLWPHHSFSGEFPTPFSRGFFQKFYWNKCAIAVCLPSFCFFIEFAPDHFRRQLRGAGPHFSFHGPLAVAVRSSAGRSCDPVSPALSLFPFASFFVFQVCLCLQNWHEVDSLKVFHIPLFFQFYSIPVVSTAAPPLL